VAALVALRLLDGAEPGDLDARVRAVATGLAAAHEHVGDGGLPDDFLEREFELHAPGGTAAGDTTYLCAVDRDRMAVSLIQSTYEGFGSGLAAAGVALQNRGAGFVETEGHPNQLRPGKRPFHTIIPGMLLHDGRASPFGVMGGAMQAQGHVQVVDAVVSLGRDPQSALDRPRFRVDPDGAVRLEPGLWSEASALERAGHRVLRAETPHDFGVGQMILGLGEALVGGSDGRGDGYAGGL
jgi:gamma-glutamyltranspeptidase/glutathione hydrolase